MKPDLLSIDDSNLVSSIVGEMSSGSKEAVLEWLSSSEARAGRLEQEAKVSQKVGDDQHISECTCTYLLT